MNARCIAIALFLMAGAAAGCGSPSVSVSEASSRKKHTPPPPPAPPPPVELGTISMWQKLGVTCPASYGSSLVTSSVTFAGNAGDLISIALTPRILPDNVGVGSIRYQLVDDSLVVLPGIPSGQPGGPVQLDVDSSWGMKFSDRLPATGRFHVLLTPQDAVASFVVDVALTPCVPLTTCDPNQQCNPADGCGGVMDCSACTPVPPSCTPLGGHCVYSSECCPGSSADPSMAVYCEGGANGTDPGTGQGFCTTPIQCPPGGCGGGGGPSPCNVQGDCPSGSICSGGVCYPGPHDPPPQCTPDGYYAGGYACCSGRLPGGDGYCY